MAKLITILIDEEGNQTASAAGWQGHGCDAVLKAFGDGVGETVKITHKPEYNKPCKNQNVVRQ